MSARWSHLLADDPDELHEFAVRLGLRRSWFQERCSVCRGDCPHWHYDVTDAKRTEALRLGAVGISYLRDLGPLVRSRREAARNRTESKEAEAR